MDTKCPEHPISSCTPSKPSSLTQSLRNTVPVSTPNPRTSFISTDPFGGFQQQRLARSYLAKHLSRLQRKKPSRNISQRISISSRATPSTDRPYHPSVNLSYVPIYPSRTPIYFNLICIYTGINPTSCTRGMSYPRRKHSQTLWKPICPSELYRTRYTHRQHPSRHPRRFSVHGDSLVSQ